MTPPKTAGPDVLPTACTASGKKVRVDAAGRLYLDGSPVADAGPPAGDDLRRSGVRSGLDGSRVEHWTLRLSRGRVRVVRRFVGRDGAWWDVPPGGVA